MADHHREALAHAQEGNWDASHNVIQKFDDPLASLIHAYLHRVEGDMPNARYWYKLAGEPFPECSIAEELQSLTAKSKAS